MKTPNDAIDEVKASIVEGIQKASENHFFRFKMTGEEQVRKQMLMFSLDALGISVTVERVHDEFKCSFALPSVAEYAETVKRLRELDACATPDSTATK